MKTLSDREVRELLRQAEPVEISPPPPPPNPQDVLTDAQIKQALESGKSTGAIEAIEDCRRSK